MKRASSAVVVAVDRYTHGHHDSVLRSHRWRTAENSAGYLLPHLHPGHRVLDVGCGPGTITIDLARRVAPGQVLGIDVTEEVLTTARRTATEGIPSGGSKTDTETETNTDSGFATPDIGSFSTRVSFAVGDVYALELDDGSFDVVHAHQVLQHLTDPVAALVEMRRVLRPGGVLAVRDADYAAFTWFPLDPRLDRWNELYHQVTEANHAQPDAGRRLRSWVRAAGFTEDAVSSSTWTFATTDDRRWWGELWAERAVRSDFAAQAVEYGLSTPAELEAIADGWRHWAATDDGLITIVHGEVIAHP